MILTQDRPAVAALPDPQCSCGAAQPRVILVDGDRRILDASPSGRQLLKDEAWLVDAFGRLTARRPADAGKLDQRLRDTERLGASRLSFGGDDETIDVDLVRLRQEGRPTCFLVLVHVAADQRHRKVAEATQEFGLTAAEERLLTILFDGCSLPEAAARLGVARSTARTHLQRLFDKTGARRQAELLRTVALSTSAFA